MSDFVRFALIFSENEGSPFQASDLRGDATFSHKRPKTVSCPLISHLSREEGKVRLSLNVLCSLLPSLCFHFFFLHFFVSLGSSGTVPS